MYDINIRYQNLITGPDDAPRLNLATYGIFPVCLSDNEYWILDIEMGKIK